jgi:hypothetical protein
MCFQRIHIPFKWLPRTTKDAEKTRSRPRYKQHEEGRRKNRKATLKNPLQLRTYRSRLIRKPLKNLISPKKSLFNCEEINFTNENLGCKTFSIDYRAKEAATIQESHTQSRTKSPKIANTVKSNSEQSLMARKYSFFKLHRDQNITLPEFR